MLDQTKRLAQDTRKKVKSAINHPDHYQSIDGNDQYEVINIIKAYHLDFHKGNIIKYLLRAGKKEKEKELEDLNKALWYLTDYIRWLESI